MARRIFFSFHYRDIIRVNQVRNHWLTKGEAAGYWDWSLWEKTKLRGDAAIKKMIDDALIGTSVTVVLIGKETDGRKYVDYEIEQSYIKRNGLLGVYIHNVPDMLRRTDAKGSNPFDRWHINLNGGKRYFSEMFYTYDWVADNGYANFAGWVEMAARNMNR